MVSRAASVKERTGSDHILITGSPELVGTGGKGSERRLARIASWGAQQGDQGTYRHQPGLLSPDKESDVALATE